MFTGIIQDVGRVKLLRRLGDTARLEALAPGLSTELRPGDSVAVNGACLTVTGRDGKGFKADLSRETLERSNLGSLRSGDSINLELPLLPTARLGGHFVQGHVDAVSRVVRIEKQRAFALFRFSLPVGMGAYVVEKGSIAVDGISLTVSGLGKDFFEVAIIPHTLEHTNLSRRKPGDRVNLECDILAKYVEAALSRRRHDGSRDGLTAEYLRDLGYR